MADAGNTVKKVKKRKGIAKIFPAQTGYTVLIFVMALLAAAFLAMMAMVNAFPADITMKLVGIMIVMFIAAWLLVCRKNRIARICGLLVAVLFLGGYGLATYYLGTTYAAFARMSTNEKTADTGFTIAEDPFNIYITGIDQWHYEKGLDLERSDVNMIITVNPQTRKVLLTSIPRDAYVRLHTAEQMDKLTHTGVYGVDETINTVEDWLGVDLNYYVKLNFTAVVNVINAMDGITVESPVAFKSSISKFTYKEGTNHMSGRQALYFARERKSFEGKDSIRVELQQLVIKAMLDKLTSSTTLLTRYGDILDAAASDLETNMPMSDMQALVKMQLGDMRSWDIQSQKITGEYDMDYVASLTQEQKFQVYKTDDASVASCLDKISAVMNPTAAELEAVEEAKKEASFRNFLKGLRGGSTDDEGSEG